MINEVLCIKINGIKFRIKIMEEAQGLVGEVSGKVRITESVSDSDGSEAEEFGREDENKRLFDGSGSSKVELVLVVVY